MSEASYIRVLKHAYFLELLGEATYQRGSRSQRGALAFERWHAFAKIEARMQLLLLQELQRVLGHWKPLRIATRLAKVLGRMAGLMSSTLLERVIKRVLDQRRYTRWAAQFGSENPRLWEALVEHELRQVDHFERRQT